MKKRKFEKLIRSNTVKHVVFEDGSGYSHIGQVVGAGQLPDTAQVNGSAGVVTVDRKNIICKVKKAKWHTMDRVPPEDRLVLLESKCGDIKMGKLLGAKGKEFYDLNDHHFHSPYWHKPFPITDFHQWSLVPAGT